MTDKEKINAIEEEIRRLIKRIALKDETDSNLEAVYGGQAYILGKVLHFINSLPEEPVSKDLEEEYHNFLKREWFDKPGKTISQMMRLTADYFANWQKEQMLKNSVEGVVTLDYWDDKDREVDVILADDVIAEEHGIKEDDKVKIIIVKED